MTLCCGMKMSSPWTGNGRDRCGAGWMDGWLTEITNTTCFSIDNINCNGIGYSIPSGGEGTAARPDQTRPAKGVEWHTHQQNQTSSSCADSRNVFFVTWMGEWWSAVSVSYMKFCLLFVLHFRCTMIRAIEIKIKIEKMVSQVRDGFNESVSEWVGPMLVSWSSSSSVRQSVQP